MTADGDVGVPLRTRFEIMTGLCAEEALLESATRTQVLDALSTHMKSPAFVSELMVGFADQDEREAVLRDLHMSLSRSGRVK
ncbi:MAG: hypothetical protein HQ481_15435 [Alphaproteobacteria bacterium]|nr:hypothetical protein [Alphaproteobacteria bacterium]